MSAGAESLSLAGWTAASPEVRAAGADAAFAAASADDHGAYILVAERTTGSRDGELAGIPFAVKDNIDVGGLPTTGGSPLLADAVAAVDAGVVSALREAGAIVVGKTNLHELAFGVTSNNAAHGPVRNPHDRERSAGGSSGGSAAAVALGSVPFALGTDTGASITVPASFCGVVGLRPSTGRYPGDGVVNLSWSRDTVGVLARSAADVRLVDRVITRSAPVAAPKLRDVVLGVPRRRFEDLDPDVARVAEQTLAALTRAGVRLVDVAIADDLEIGAGPGLELVLYEAERTLTERARAADPSITSFADLVERIASPDVKGLAGMIAGSPFPATAYEVARAARARLRRSYAEVFETSGAVALVAPSCAVLPPPVGVDDVVDLGGRDEPLFATITRNTAPGTVAGIPMLTLPSGWSASGLPIGMTYEGRFFRDDELLALGEELERVTGGPSA